MIKLTDNEIKSPFDHVDKTFMVVCLLFVIFLSSCSYMQPSSYSTYSAPDHLRVEARGMAANIAAEVNTSSIYMNSVSARQFRAEGQQNRYRSPRYRHRRTNRILDSTDRIVNNALNTTVREINRVVTQAIRRAF